MTPLFYKRKTVLEAVVFSSKNETDPNKHFKLMAILTQRIRRRFLVFREVYLATEKRMIEEDVQAAVIAKKVWEGALAAVPLAAKRSSNDFDFSNRVRGVSNLRLQVPAQMESGGGS